MRLATVGTLAAGALLLSVESPDVVCGGLRVIFSWVRR